jgi:hypothetical protein
MSPSALSAPDGLLHCRPAQDNGLQTRTAGLELKRRKGTSSLGPVCPTDSVTLSTPHIWPANSQRQGRAAGGSGDEAVGPCLQRVDFARLNEWARFRGMQLWARFMGDGVDVDVDGRWWGAAHPSRATWGPRIVLSRAHGIKEARRRGRL